MAAEDMGFESAAEEAQLQTKAGGLIRSYLAKIAGETSRPVAVETAVESPLIDPRTGEDLGIPLVGVLDLVLEEHAGPVIVDFKTAARADQLSELSHEIQLGCYAYLFRQTTGLNESALEIRRLVKTKMPQPKPFKARITRAATSTGRNDTRRSSIQGRATWTVIKASMRAHAR